MSDAGTPIALQIPPQGYIELEHLATHAGKLQDVVQVTLNLPLDTNAIDTAKVVAERIGLDIEVAGIILSGLATLRNLMQQSDASARELVETLSQSLLFGEAKEWREKNLPTWSNARNSIEVALELITENHPLLLRQKALELTYAHQNIFRRSRIMTDLRPVFNVEGDTLHAMVLTHILSIEYYDGVRRQRIEFALDQDDVCDLQKATERAKTKTDATIKKLKAQNLTVIVGGGVSSID